MNRLQTKWTPLLCNQKGEDVGATIIEFALASFVFFFLLLGFFDFARYVTVQGMLTKAAQNALVTAQTTSGIELDLRSLDLLCSPATPPGTPGCAGMNEQKFNQFRSAIDKVENDGKKFALSSLFIGSSNSLTTSIPLTSYAITRTVNYLTNPTPFSHNFDLILLRPGEDASFTDSKGNLISVAHPTKPTLLPSETFESALRQHPLFIQMRAEVEPVAPFLPTLVAVGTAIGFRETTPPGSHPGKAEIESNNSALPCCPAANPGDPCVVCHIPGPGGSNVDPCAGACGGLSGSGLSCPCDSGVQCMMSGGSCMLVCGTCSGS